MTHDTETRQTPRGYTRWTTGQGIMLADLVGCRHEVAADVVDGTVLLNGQVMNPDAARLIGVRLIEAAALADGPRAIRTGQENTRG